MVDDFGMSEEEVLNKIRHMEEMGVKMSLTYSEIITQEFSN